VFDWFKQKSKFTNPLRVDMHSHLLPGLDDGVQSFEDSLTIINKMKEFGYDKIVTTPHIISDAYRNSPETILPKLAELQSFLKDRGVQIEISAAAEYYLDEALMKKISGDEPLLTFGKKFLLFETNFLNEPMFLKEFIFSATTKGYRLILAHPERYIYLQHDLSKAQDLIDRGVLFQLNLISLTGYYSKEARTLAEKLINKGQVHLLGTDCHTIAHTLLIEQSFRSKYFQKAISLPLLNNTLL
jgi:protein-tyrosine phosphatase